MDEPIKSIGVENDSSTNVRWEKGPSEKKKEWDMETVHRGGTDGPDRQEVAVACIYSILSFESSFGGTISSAWQCL
jgi:hypothetical protein